MSVDSLRIERIPTRASEEALEPCRRIRQTVFVEEQQVSSELEWDDLDGEAEHFVAFTLSEGSPDEGTPERVEQATPVGTARLRILADYAKAERVAVLLSGRRRGVGLALMHALEERAAARGTAEIRLNAQIVAEPFYRALDYQPFGDPFEEAGIPHIAMRKTLSPRSAS